MRLETSCFTSISTSYISFTRAVRCSSSPPKSCPSCSIRIPVRAALSIYAGPIPLLVVPIPCPFFSIRICSIAPSISLWKSKSMCASGEMKSLLTTSIPCSFNVWISSSSVGRCSTNPAPMTIGFPSCMHPEGRRWKMYFSPSMTIVWPAFAPPHARAIMSYSSESMSVAFPFPSSPH